MTNQGKNAIDTLLAESFKEIASSKPIEKITIKEITDKAGVIRPTFYNHFQDKYELLEWIVRRELMDGIREGIADGKFRESIITALSTMTEEKSFYTNAEKLTGQNSFKEILFAAVKDLIVSYFDVESFKIKDYCAVRQQCVCNFSRIIDRCGFNNAYFHASLRILFLDLPGNR